MTALRDDLDPAAAAIGWVGPLMAVLAMQTVAAGLSRVASILAPAIAERIGWSVPAVGGLVTTITVGSMIFLVAASPLLRRFGSLRMLQGGLVAGAIGIALHAGTSPAAALAGSLLIGLGLGPAAAAGTEVLHRHAPVRHRNLVFSIKQAGVPLGGMLAGLTLPALAQSRGIAAVAVVSALATLAVALALQPLRARIDAGRDRAHRIGWREIASWRNVRRPVTALLKEPALRRLGLAAAPLALCQGVWFAFLASHLVVAMGWSLTAAGALFALMQAVSTAGRPLAGWVADRAASATAALRWTSIASALTTLALAATGPAWPTWTVVALGVVAGLTVSSWNGVAMAEVARLSPPGTVAETSSGFTLLVFGCNAAGPALVGLLAAAGTGASLRVAFAASGILSLAAVVPLARAMLERPAGR